MPFNDCNSDAVKRRGSGNGNIELAMGKIKQTTIDIFQNVL
jgi:hypothetical protein